MIIKRIKLNHIPCIQRKKTFSEQCKLEKQSFVANKYLQRQ
jgi:hypothetical protein